MNAIRTEKLRKTFKGKGGGVEALKGVSLEVRQGEIFGLLGPNGAGKTTLVKVLLGITSATAGAAFIFEQPAGSVAAKKNIGFLPENHRYPSYLTGGQMLSLYGGMAGLSGALLRNRIDEMLELVGMTQWKKTPIKKYSKGMMQRVGLAQALLSKPRLVFLDEPTDGIDPVGRREVREVLYRVKETGTTIFLNSHLLSEVEVLTDRVAILRKGEVVQIGKTDELTAHEGLYDIILAGTISSNILASISGYLRSSGTLLELRADTTAALNKAIDELRAASLEIVEIRRKQSSLEDLFFALINEK